MTGQNKKVQLWMVVAGAAIVAGFFLPLVDYHGLKLVSGWQLLWESRAPVGDRLLIGCAPLGGVALVLTALAGVTSARWISLGVGGLIVVYPAFKLVTAVLEVAGSGAFLLVGGGIAALCCGVLALAKR